MKDNIQSVFVFYFRFMVAIFFSIQMRETLFPISMALLMMVQDFFMDISAFSNSAFYEYTKVKLPDVLQYFGVMVGYEIPWSLDFLRKKLKTCVNLGLSNLLIAIF